MAPVDYLTDLIFGTQRTELSFDTSENIDAAATLQDWANAGYFSPGFGGAATTTPVTNFAKGEGLFMITGNWIVEDLGRRQHPFGFFPMPPMDAGAPPVATGGAGFPLSIAAGTRPPRRRGRLHRLDDERSREPTCCSRPASSRCTTAATASVQPGTVLADVVNAAAP